MDILHFSKKLFTYLFLNETVFPLKTHDILKISYMYLVQGGLG